MPWDRSGNHPRNLKWHGLTHNPRGLVHLSATRAAHRSVLQWLHSKRQKCNIGQYLFTGRLLGKPTNARGYTRVINHQANQH